MNWTRIILGAICGVVATGPMTAAMAWWHRRLPTRDKYPLPPHEITDAVARRAGLPMSASALSAATLIAHFAYGGGAGALYGAAPMRRLGSPTLAGLMLGFCVWSLSYFGLLPALGILRPATEHPVRRNALMLGAHFVWGMCLTVLHRLLLDDADRTAPAFRQRAAGSRDTYPADP